MPNLRTIKSCVIISKLFCQIHREQPKYHVIFRFFSPLFRQTQKVQFPAMNLAVYKHKLMTNKLLYEQAFQTLLIRQINGN